MEEKLMYKIDYKPLSANESWKGKRFKSKKYKIYEKIIPHFLPQRSKDIKDTDELEVNYEFGFSSKSSDVDNPIKQFQDILFKNWQLNDKNIYYITARKKIVPKGEEYIKFKIGETLIHKIDYKPLSVNEAWQGKRFKSKKYKIYEKIISSLLPSRSKAIKDTDELEVNYEFGFSSKLSDVDNPIKQFQDILFKNWQLNDKNIYYITARKKIVPKGEEYIKFRIKKLEVTDTDNDCHIINATFVTADLS